MSWNIFVYAEVKHKGSDTWEPLVNGCVCDDFKYYDDSYCEEMCRMKASEASHPSVKELSCSSYGIDFSVNYCSLKELREHYMNIIDKFKAKLSAIYTALGVSSLSLDDEDYYDEDEFNDESKSDGLFPWIKYMTFPVNKRMFLDISSSLHLYQKANQVLGMCDTISSMCENYDDEIRLLFATL